MVLAQIAGAGVLATVLAGLLLDGAAPYFPCEISKTATGPRSAVLLRGTAALLLVVATAAGRLFFDVGLTAGLLGLALLSALDTRRHWGGHMAGVALLLCGCLYAVVESAARPPEPHWWHQPGSYALLAPYSRAKIRWIWAAAEAAPFLLGALLYAGRIALVSAATLHLEMGEPLAWQTYAVLLVEPSRLLRLVRRVKQGHANDYRMRSPWTLRAFQLGGVLQWLCLALMTRQWHHL